jgi:membrane protein implicated in regulation of membrane protease activity
MRLPDVILVLGPIVLLAFALGIVDAQFIRFLVLGGVFLAGTGGLAYWLLSRSRRSRSRENQNRNKEGPNGP